MTGASKTPPSPGGVKTRGVNDLIGESWRLIDQAKKRLSDPSIKETDKIRWAGVLASAIGTLNKLLWKAGAGKVEGEDLASILSKVPEKFAKMVKRKLKDASKDPGWSAGVSVGDVIQVSWLDASLSRGVVKITNRVVATYKRTVGRFMGFYSDTKYHRPHVIIQHETDETGSTDMSSIPLSIVVDVKVFAQKTPLKSDKRGTDAQWTQPLEDGGLKIMTRRARRC